MKPSELVTWRGTPGVGDFMWALNSCHRYAADYNIRKINLEFHWEHDEDYLHHFEDPETIIERLNYIHSFYHQKERVEVHHVFNAQGRYRDWKFDDDVILEKNGERRIAAIQRDKARFWFQSGVYTDESGGTVPNSDWIMRKDAMREIVPNRLVFWRPTWNAEQPRTWKRLFTQSDWDIAIQLLKDRGFDCHEISYRTPVSEAVYLISTSRLVLCYDGIWHYLAKNFARPLAVVSSEGVTRYHTPNALRLHSQHEYKDKNVWWWLENVEILLGHTKQKAVKYERGFEEYYGND